MRHWLVAVLVLFTIVAGTCQASPKIDLVAATIDDRPIIGMTADEIIKTFGQPTVITNDSGSSLLYYVDIAMEFIISPKTNQCNQVIVTGFDGLWLLPNGEVTVKPSPFLPFTPRDSVNVIVNKLGVPTDVYTEGKMTYIRWKCSKGWASLACQYGNDFSYYSILIE